ncbi:MAG: UDP-3-O-acyl-N-acetylglucosamine deacetylase [Candidatus Melainabacteria bacterium]|nr:UDP-3-O-acyl-N-acetylglucosamine deacetylase [Candidatus Melainabacteria bacterium]
MSEKTYKVKEKILHLHGKGLFSKEEVTVSINKIEGGSGITFVINKEKIPGIVSNVSNSNRNTVLTEGNESICLVEHFLAACSLLGIDGLEVITDKNELIFDDGSALHWYKAFSEAGLSTKIFEKYDLKETIFCKNGEKEIIAIPHNGFKVSYFMDWNHPALGRLWASWQQTDGVEKLLRARSFATKEENDFFGVSDRLLTLEKDNFNKKLHELLEPLYHKILDIIGDLRLCGVNPLEINMHVIGFKSGHALNVELARELKDILSKK